MRFLSQCSPSLIIFEHDRQERLKRVEQKQLESFAKSREISLQEAQQESRLQSLVASQNTSFDENEVGFGSVDVAGHTGLSREGKRKPVAAEMSTLPQIRRGTNASVASATSGPSHHDFSERATKLVAQGSYCHTQTVCMCECYTAV